MAENVTLEKVLLGDTTKEYVDKVNKAIDNVNSNSDAIENLTDAVANAGKVDDVKVNGTSVVSNKIANVTVNGSSTVNVTTSETGEITISAPKLAKSLTLSVDTSTYVLKATLRDSNENILSAPTVDLPLETMVVGASYDESTKEIVLTLKNGMTSRFSVADLVAGLVATDNNFKDGQVLVADGNGKKAKSSGFTIKTSVPANAKFTDTTYENATTSKSGLMSTTDKAKLDRIDSSLEGVTADQIGKVKDVKVNGSTVLGTDGVANITIDDLKAGYVSVSSSSLVDCTVNGTTYKAIKVADTDTELEVYNSAGNKILTHTVREEGYLYICVGTTAINCTLRKINGNSVGSGGSTLYRHNLILKPQQSGYGTAYATIISTKKDEYKSYDIPDLIEGMGYYYNPETEANDVRGLYPASGRILKTLENGTNVSVYVLGLTTENLTGGLVVVGDGASFILDGNKFVDNVSQI